MSIELNQQLQPAMQVKVTPKQIAANYILQMSSMALQEAISQELDENPALEMLETSACPICGAPVTGNYCTECMPRKESANDESIAAVDELPADAAPRLRDEADEFDPIARAEAEFTLDEHLTWNLHAILPRDLHDVADHVIGALDENGFLTETDAEIAAATGHTVDEVAEVVAAMRGIEPIGIGSRSIVRESCSRSSPGCARAVRWRCRRSPRRSSASISPSWGSGSSATWRWRWAWTRRSVIATWEFVKANLNPYPTAAFTAAISGSGQRTLVRPDVLIREVDGELEVEVVESRRFSLRVTPIYSSRPASSVGARRPSRTSSTSASTSGARSSSSTHATAGARRSSASPNAWSNGSATTCSTASSTSSRSPGRRWAT